MVGPETIAGEELPNGSAVDAELVAQLMDTCVSEVRVERAVRDASCDDAIRSDRAAAPRRSSSSMSASGDQTSSENKR
ncbi:hypothetical protein AB0383_43655 [Amycolatopsis sp. NPDC051373]|uniref:hypothetical protein n=1 Tax=Amycolatopsis sp. NPDC051373 TaxID=3155801 RepID=UPI00345083E7